MAEGGGVVKRLWAAQQRRFALWTPFLIGLGVWIRLGSDWVMSGFVAVACAVIAVGGIYVWRSRGVAIGVYSTVSVMLLLAGYGAAGLRIAVVDAPVLSDGFRGEITGRVIAADRSRSDAPRVLLDGLSLTGVHRSAVPERVRITLVDARRAPEIGAVVSVDGILGPPSGPAAPGGFDFSRQAFFRQIGAVGYARGAVEIVSLSDDARALWLTRLRTQIAEALRERIGGDEGAVAAALIVGDRSAISDETTDALRDSGLAHLLAISGLHIGLMSALMFWLVRFGLALMPIFASRVAIRKIAAVAGLAAAGGYLALAGFGVATQRAFIMAAVAFAAILLDRPAVTARGLAAAACLVLLLRPESLFEAGFQMSFAAVAALVAGFEVTQRYWTKRAENPSLMRRVWSGLIATVATSVMAGAATAPFAAYHFNRLVAYGLPANVLATPIMGLLIMPAIILTAALAPFGLAGVGLAVLGWGIGYILWVAEAVAGLEGAAMSVPAGTPLALALIVFGGLWLVIWRGVLRCFAVPIVLAGVIVWRGTVQPDVFIAEGARLIAARGDAGGLWVSRERTSSYSAETWLRRSGEGNVSQEQAYERRVWTCSRTSCTGKAQDGTAIVLIRNRSRRALDKACTVDAIVIAPRLFDKADITRPCTMIDRRILDDASSVAVTLKDGSRPVIQVATPTALDRGSR